MEENFRDRVKKTKKFSVYLEQMKCDSKFGEVASEIEKFLPDPGTCEEHVFEGQDTILIAGYPAVAGCSILAEYYEEELKKQFPIQFIRETQELKKEIDRLHEELLEIKNELPGTVSYMLGEGGMRRTLYQLGKESKKGFRIHYHAVPVHQESIEICEFYNCDPWEMFSGGSMLLVTNQTRGVQQVMRRAGIICSRVGYLTDDKEKSICCGEIKSSINRPLPDALLKILQKKLGEE